ncbi:MAG: CPBP family intramembrane metalloprotease [Thiothrix sp.]|nr:CPBP family intramembrane metalloprotease [Thiothrix sp.]HPQ94588.1 CPBP family intramembrane metalloprotease [Thiolinea sp.]
MKHNPLDQVPSRLALAAFFFANYGMGLLVYFYLLPAFVPAGAASLQDSPPGAHFILDNLTGLAGYLLTGLLLWLLPGQQRDELAALALNLPTRTEAVTCLKLGFAMVGVSMALLYLVYYPLSFVASDYVQQWLAGTPLLMYWDENSLYLPGNLAGIVLMVLLAPVVEEYLFRGYLLNRWTLRFGAMPAMLGSSMLFALLHQDILGALVFGLLASLLAMQTRSLIAPILMHLGNNLLVVLLQWVDLAFISGFEPETLESFRDSVWIGVLGLALGAPILRAYALTHFRPVGPLLLKHQRGGDGSDYLA